MASQGQRGAERVGDKASEAAQRTAEQARKAKEQTKGVMQQMRDRAPLNQKQALGLVTVLIGGTVLLVGGGLAIGGTIITLLLASPLLLLFSPILVPVGIVLFLGTSGLVAAGTTLLAFLSGIVWLYRYFRGRQPPGSVQLDSARHRVMETASKMQERAREYGSNVLQKAQEAAPGA
ncbi:hypothetical protein O6H91_04G137000 [Diphasiastrum complanatum]|uniref:Uncharacterized protein n=1 Tax=Diphasiastrum complanatum TaxID=34168 RepID=A0ACC2E2H7_DIPCM|nr:hypothetical protein O6H91_04G137000 [Diphasiastrum complanatum]